MPAKDVWQKLQALRRRAHNLKPRDIERVAEEAGWVYHHTTGGHAIYIKEGFPPNLSIKLHNLGGKLALRLLDLIESSLYEEEKGVSHDDQEGR
jgi:predicted RNA binding protein YcfA (HicA-like mRNA interferase family)